MVPVWSEADSHSYRLNEAQARRRQTEPGATDLAVTGHYWNGSFRRLHHTSTIPLSSTHALNAGSLVCGSCRLFVCYTRPIFLSKQT